MDEHNTASAMSSSLLARDVYCVCFPERDGLDSLEGELTQARKKYFTGGKKTVKVGKSEVIKGFDGKLHGKLSRRGFYWKKFADKISLEEAFDQKSGHVVVRRDFRNVIVSRTFFDRDHRWIRSEYYEPWDPVTARVTFKPSDTSDTVERFDRESGGKSSRSVELFPLPYLAGTPEQSILNARFGEPRFLVSTAEGEFCYCPKRETELRKKAMEEITSGSIMLMPAWEVRDGALAGEEGEEQTNVTFTSLEEYARIEPPKGTEEDKPQEETPPEVPAAPEGEEFTPGPEEESAEPVETTSENSAAPMAATAEKTEDELILEAARKAAGLEEQKPRETASEDASPAGITLGGMGYRGELRDGKREGFGSYYYKDGSLCYAGFWKDDKKDGLGVSFRDTDHALHVAKWENGKPGGFVSLFDKDGNLRYGGRIENGKKQGVGVSFNQEDGTVFVGKWEDGAATGLGSAFDREGSLLYYGGWKNGKRSGHGTEFDKNGGIVFDGEWKDGKYHNGILYQKLTQEPSPDESGPDWDI